jgi:hypothetical protein
MKRIADLRVGDPVERKMNGIRNQLWGNSGEVVEVTETQIVCLVYVDVPRRMTFDRQTGVSVLGPSYGWLHVGE